MSLILFSLDYYENKIEQYESHPCNAHEVYEAKQLLKMIVIGKELSPPKH